MLFFINGYNDTSPVQYIYINHVALISSENCSLLDIKESKFKLYTASLTF